MSRRGSPKPSDLRTIADAYEPGSPDTPLENVTPEQFRLSYLVATYDEQIQVADVTLDAARTVTRLQELTDTVGDMDALVLAVERLQSTPPHGDGDPTEGRQR